MFISGLSKRKFKSGVGLHKSVHCVRADMTLQQAVDLRDQQALCSLALMYEFILIN